MSFLIRQTLIYAIPLMIVALAGIFAERSGIINLALEGIMIFGAFIGVLFVRILQATGCFDAAKAAGDWMALQGYMFLTMLVAAASLGINVVKMRYAGVLISGALAGMGGFVYAMTTANCSSNGDVAGFGFLALAVMIFGNWKPLNVAGGALLFGLFKCIAASYSTLDINGDGIYWLNTIGLNGHFYRLLPYLITLIVLAFTSKSSRAPKAEGIPYDKGTR